MANTTQTPIEVNPSELSMEDFIALPDVAAAVMRYDDAAQALLNENPDIRTGKLLDGNYVIIYVQRDKLLRLVSTESGGFYRGIFPFVVGLLGLPDLNAAGITEVRQQPYLNLRGGGVLLGFVDTGIDYTLPAFRYEDGSTRIKYIWDQTIRSAEGEGAPPDGYGFGTEYTEERLNAALRTDDPRQTAATADTAGHGTFLASLAGSREEGEYAGAAPDAEFVIVKLKRAGGFYRETYRVPATQENAFESSDVMLGIQYIIEKAAELDRPVSIAIGVGTNFGGHDGFSLFEEYLTRVSFRQGVALTAAAGNESAARHHAQGVIAGNGETETIEIRAGEASHAIFMNMWNNSADRMSVSVTSPAGENVGRIAAKSGTTFVTKLVLERSTVRIQYFFPVEGSGNQLTVITVDDPTPGIWRIGVYGEIIIDGTFHAWLPLTGFADEAVEFLSPSPDGTVVVPATSAGVITAAAFNGLTNSLYADSSWGPTRLPSISPDLAAPGVDAAGTFPGGVRGTMSGTSVSAAITAGACALILDWGIVQGNDPALNTYLIKPRLIMGCDRDLDKEYPNMQWGYGRLNLINTFYALRGM